jgi:predicted HAD superfamily Cof-like phosphohydrolase
MNRMQEQLVEWHKKFGVLVNEAPTIPDEKTKTLRMRLIQEEAHELYAGIQSDDMLEIADGLADLLYVVFGTAVSFGIDIEKVFNEVHRSNMSKLWPDGTVHYDAFGKVVKPPTYSKADIAGVLGEIPQEARK